MAGPKKRLAEIETVVRAHRGGISLSEIESALETTVPRRTIQHDLRMLVDQGRLVREGERRWARYASANACMPAVADAVRLEAEEEADIPISASGGEVRAYVRRPVTRRKPSGYDPAFLGSYRPNASAYLTEAERQRLRRIGTAETVGQPAGTYARQVLNRLLIDLSWNSSRLEGNTYSLLDTRRLVAFGEQAKGKHHVEAQMILNHKEAIEYLVESATDIGFDRRTIMNLHALLATNLLPDETAAGRLRRIPVGIDSSVFHPLEVPQLIEERFNEILQKASAIADPFEQSFFVMVQLPYLQPFDDVNKRVSRLAANIPLIRENLTPLSFIDVPRSTYTDATLGVYELNRIDLLKDVFVWAYERSAERYTAVRQSIGEPDPFRLRHRDALRSIVREVVRDRLGRKAGAARVAEWTTANVGVADRERFRDLAESELLGLHEGNFARYRLRPSEFDAWFKAWNAGRKT